MNHIARDFASRDGRSYKMHSWELRQGGYRRIALLWGNGLWPVSEETRLIGFLVQKGFKVVALDLAYGCSEQLAVGLRAFRAAAATLSASVAAEGLPVYLVASSFSATALVGAAKEIAPVVAAALLSPVLALPPPGLRSSFPFFGSAALRVEAGTLSGEPALLDGHMDRPRQYRFRKRDLRALSAESPVSRASALAGRAAAFAGEEDPWLGRDELGGLEKLGVKVYTYPRVRREIARDRYADNFYADFGAFLDETGAKTSLAGRG
jgi:alpha-beta hydrolase superfamily lysophospholipase